MIGMNRGPVDPRRLRYGTVDPPARGEADGSLCRPSLEVND
jgi:hypothetical protein